MKFTRDQLCIIQQALGLREMIMTNSTDLVEVDPKQLELIRETKSLRERVVSEIRSCDRYGGWEE